MEYTTYWMTSLKPYEQILAYTQIQGILLRYSASIQNHQMLEWYNYVTEMFAVP